MRKHLSLIILSASLATLTMSAALRPEAGKYYRIQHASGLYMADGGFHSKLAELADENTQIVEFVPVEGQTDVYNIRRVSSGMFIGTDKKWSTTSIYTNHPQSQFRIVDVEGSDEWMLLENLSMNAPKNHLGCDADNNGNVTSGVYTDKDGSSSSLHYWKIVEATKYEAGIPENAQNVLANGDFETEGFEQAKDGDSGLMTLTVLPGWTIEQCDKWNGAQSLETTESGNALVLEGYQGNGWADVAVSQTVAVTPGHEYVLTYKYMHPTDDGCTFGAKVVEGDNTLVNNNSGAKVEEWADGQLRFTPAAAEVKVVLYLSNRNSWWRDKRAKFDDVKLFDISPVDFYAQYDLPETDVRKNAYPGYKLVFAEEFSNNGELDRDVWNAETGFKRNHEEQYYNGYENTYIEDGVLVIKGDYVLDQQIKNPKYDRYNNSWPSTIGRYLTWTSGSIQSQSTWNGGYSWNYGIYEVRAKVPQFVGSWPAIWSTGKSHEWPYGGEIDIMEYYGHRIHANVCWGNGNRYGATWNSATVHDNELGAGWGDQYHIWRMIWDYDHMELWCDDFLVNNIDLSTTYNAVPDADYDHGNGCNPFRDVRHMMWLNLALGGDNGGSLDNTPRPLYYLVDYARVYQKVGTDGLATYHVDEEVSEPTFAWQSGVENISAVPADEEVKEIFNLQGISLGNNVDSLRGTGMPYILVTASGSRKVVL